MLVGVSFKGHLFLLVLVFKGHQAILVLVLRDVSICIDVSF